MGKGLHSPQTAVIERCIYQQITKEDFSGLSLFPVCEKLKTFLLQTIYKLESHMVQMAMIREKDCFFFQQTVC